MAGKKMPSDELADILIAISVIAKKLSEKVKDE